MKNTYSILSLFFILFSISVFGQSKIYAPTLRAPEDTADEQAPNAVLDWDAVTGITLDITYEVQLATDADFTDAVTFPRTELSSETMADLFFGGNYFWRVRAYDSDDVSDWSSIWSFTVIESFSFDVSPRSGKIVQATEEISWPEVTGLTKYQLEIDTAYTWQLMQTVTDKPISGSFVFPDGTMWIAGEEGLLRYYNGSEWITYDIADEDVVFTDVFFVNESFGYAVGKSNVAYEFDGSNWSEVSISIGTDYFDVSFANENLGWIVGKGGKIINYVDGVWSAGTSPVTSDLFSIFSLGETNVWACGKSKVLFFDGTEWTDETVGTKDLNDIYFVDENNGYVVGKTGTIFHFDGIEWIEESSNTTKDLYGVSFADDYGIAVGSSGTLLTNSAGTWEEEPSGVEYMLTTANVLSADKVYFMGDYGVVLTNGSGEFSSPYAYTANIGPDSMEYQLEELMFGQSYYYRLRGMHNVDTSAWSTVKSIRVQSSPVLESPDNNIMDTELELAFTWFEFDGVTNYIFEVADNEDFTNVSSFLIDEDAITVFGFIFGQEYFWRVAAQHIEDISDWSDVWRFTTGNSIVLEVPENNATKVSACPLYTWVEVLGATGYELWLDTDENFSNPSSMTVDVPLYQCQSSIEKNTTYYWKVRGLSGATYSEWSDTWSFKTEGYIGIDEQFNENSVNIYPNPGNGDFTLNITSLTNDSYDIKVVDVSGKVIYLSSVECMIGDNNLHITLDNVISGAYSLILSKDETMVTKQLLIK